MEPGETNVKAKTKPKLNPTESSSNPSTSTASAESPTVRTKRKRTPSRPEREEEQPEEAASSVSSLDTGRQPPPLREPSVSAETTTSLTAMSSTTVRPESITSTVAPDALGRQLTAIRRIFFTLPEQCTQSTFLMAHESVVSLLSDMRLSMYSGSPDFVAQREEAMQFVTAIGVVCRVIALKLEWPTDLDDTLLEPMRSWDGQIRRSWDGWVIQFIRLASGWFEDVIAPNNIHRELGLSLGDAPDMPLVAVGREIILFESLSEMSEAFERFLRLSEKTEYDNRFWALGVLRSLVLVLGDGINFAFIEGAFSPAIDEDIDEEEAQTLLDAFEASRPPGIYPDEEEDSEEDGEGDDDDDSFMLYGHEDGDENYEDDEDEPPFYFFPSRRGGLSHPERNAAKDVPVVSHRKAYSGHCNVQTVHSLSSLSDQ